MRKLIAPLATAALAAALAGCVVSVGPTGAGSGMGPMGNRPPVIQALDYSPKGVIGKNDAVTFTMVATDPEGQPLSYTWTSTRGTLSATTGQTVNWRPLKPDGSIDPGQAAITVLVSDGVQTATGTLNLQIDPQGQATVQGSVSAATPAPSASPTPAPAASATPTPAPSASASPSPTPAPSATPAPEKSATAAAD